RSGDPHPGDENPEVASRWMRAGDVHPDRPREYPSSHCPPSPQETGRQTPASMNTCGLTQRSTTESGSIGLDLLPPDYFAPLIPLANIAAKTSVVRLTTGILVLQMRDPVLLAKQDGVQTPPDRPALLAAARDLCARILASVIRR